MKRRPTRSSSTYCFGLLRPRPPGHAFPKPGQQAGNDKQCTHVKAFFSTQPHSTHPASIRVLIGRGVKRMDSRSRDADLSRRINSAESGAARVAIPAASRCPSERPSHRNALLFPYAQPPPKTKTTVLPEWVVDFVGMPLLGAGRFVGDYGGASVHRLRRDASWTLGVHRYRGAGSSNRGGSSAICFC